MSTRTPEGKGDMCKNSGAHGAQYLENICGTGRKHLPTSPQTTWCDCRGAQAGPMVTPTFGIERETGW